MKKIVLIAITLIGVFASIVARPYFYVYMKNGDVRRVATKEVDSLSFVEANDYRPFLVDTLYAVDNDSIASLLSTIERQNDSLSAQFYQISSLSDSVAAQYDVLQQQDKLLILKGDTIVLLKDSITNMQLWAEGVAVYNKVLVDSMAALRDSANNVMIGRDFLYLVIQDRNDSIVGLLNTINLRNDSISHLNDTINLRNNNIANLNDNVSQLTSDKDSLHSVVASQNSTISSLTDTINLRNDSIVDLVSRVNDLKVDRDSLQNVVANKADSLKSLGDTIFVQSSTIAQLNQTIEELKTEDREVLMNSIKAYQDTLVDLRSDNLLLEKTVSVKRDSIVGLTDTISLLSASLAERDESISSLTDTISLRNDNIANLVNRVNDLKTGRDSLQNVVANKTDSLKNLGDTIFIRNSTIAHLNQSIEDLKTEDNKVLMNSIRAYQDTLVGLRSDSLLLERTISVKRDSIVGLNDSISSLNISLVEREENISSLTDTLNLRDRALIGLADNISSLTYDNDSLKQVITAKEAALTAFSDSISTLNLSLAEREENISNLTDTIHLRDNALIALTENIDTLTYDNDSLKQVITTKEEALSALDDSISSLNLSLAERDENISSLNDTLNLRDYALIGLADNISSLTYDNDSLKQVITTKEETLTAFSDSISLLNLSLAEREENISSLTDTLNLRDSALIGLAENINDLSAEKDSLQKVIVNQKDSINTLNSKIVLNNSEIEELNRTINELAIENADSLKNIIKANKDTIIALRTENNSLSASITYQGDSIEVLNNGLAQLNQKLVLYSDSLNILADSIVVYRNDLTALDADNQNLQTIIATQKNALQETKGELSAKSDSIVVLKDTVALLRANLSQKEVILAQQEKYILLMRDTMAQLTITNDSLQTVIDAMNNYVPQVKSIRLNYSDTTVMPNAFFELIATTSPDKVSEIEWRSADPAIAQVINGAVLAKDGGHTQIVASYGNYQAICNLTVRIEAEAVSVSGREKLTIGKTQQLSATLTPANTTDEVVWSSSDETIATVDSKGVVTALKGGFVTITAKAGSQTSSFDMEIELLRGLNNGHEWVDLGLTSGLRWAAVNVGAESETSVGDYIDWGATATSSSYTMQQQITLNQSPSYGHITFMKKIEELSSYVEPTDDGYVLKADNDFAHAQWSSTWRTPTEADFKELLKECTWVWESNSGISGYRVVGPNGESIFLPTTGSKRKATIWQAEEVGYYWTSTPEISNAATRYSRGLYISKEESPSLGGLLRCYGHAVRAVCE